MYSKNGRHGNFVEVKFEKLSCMSPDAHLENFIWGGEKGAEYFGKVANENSGRPLEIIG